MISLKCCKNQVHKYKLATKLSNYNDNTNNIKKWMISQNTIISIHTVHGNKN